MYLYSVFHRHEVQSYKGQMTRDKGQMTREK